MTKWSAIALGLGISLTACGGTASKSTPSSPSPDPPPPANITVVNHIIYMLQENESFDRYFGQLNAYRQSLGLGADVDVTPSNASQLGYDGSTIITPFHMLSMCTDIVSPGWSHSHFDWNLKAPISGTPLMNGFAYSAGSISAYNRAISDKNGKRVMGYYDQQDFPYYYFLATQFAMSDRWFSPVMTNTPANRMYAMAATSQGVTGLTNTAPNGISATTIFDELQKAGVTWKDYVPDYPQGSSLVPFPTYSHFQSNIVPLSDYFSDLKNGNLPQVAFIDDDAKNDLDEHPGPGVSVQAGSAFVASIIDALMSSSSWKDSVFFLSYDEAGGFYDHVPPVATVSPDGIPPILLPYDVCSHSTGPNCNFVFTGFRVPNIVVSPFSKAHYVDHTPIDHTAILAFIEKRFGLPSLTKRDAAQPDISFFFDFGGAPNMTPPTPPSQPTNGPCYVNTLP